MFGYHGVLLVPSFETTGLGPETDYLSPSYDVLNKGSFFTRSWASRNKMTRSSILGPASLFYLWRSFSTLGRIRAFEQETRDLDVEIKQMKELKANYDVTSLQELRRNMMGEVDIETLTIEQYLMLTQGNQAPGMVKPNFGMKEKDIEDMTIAEYNEYEAEMKRRSWRNVRPYFPTNHEDTNISTFHHNKRKVLDYLHHSYNSNTNVYYDLPPLLPCFKLVQLPTICRHELLEEDTDCVSEDES
ncbi:hypothetical protein Tco_0952243 [Tanacetum coccineum]|uniref:Uncharacterized protein n=1 Tax=Tanacetum coccineum TaxID=301880 RepID=A0ABQ5DZA7_9ASTR